MFTDIQKTQLSEKLDTKHVSQRSQNGMSLSYIEGWHAIAEANRIFGFDGWSCETVEMRLISETTRKLKGGRDGWSVTYICKSRVTVGHIVREGYGTGHGNSAQIGDAHESAIKEAETDALKRALRTFGNKFGLALYDKKQEQVSDLNRDNQIKIFNQIKVDLNCIETVEDLADYISTGEFKHNINMLPEKGAASVNAFIAFTKSKLIANNSSDECPFD